MVTHDARRKTQDPRVVLVLALAFILSGCVVRTYQITRDRIDQDLTTGNRGYLKGEAPAQTQERKTTRTTQVVEVELRSPVKIERASKHKFSKAQPASSEEALGNRGYITQGIVSKVVASQESFEKYTVQKGDTLQKISKKFYGTTKKWVKIFDANKEALKGPNKIYPGQVINVPIEPLKATKENLK
jgi:nucleoid-associated protein YgaU